MQKASDYRLETRAENGLWPVTQEHRQKTVDSAFRDLDDADPRVVDAARKYLLAVDNANDKKKELEQRRLDSEHARKLQLIELAVKLGIARPDTKPTGISDRGSSEGE
jgi:hypothetical protein